MRMSPKRSSTMNGAPLSTTYKRYSEAAKEYEPRLRAKTRSSLLFNLGQAYRLARQYSNAIGAYRSYLRRLPDTPNRAEVEDHIRELQQLEQEAQAAKPVITPPKPQVMASAPAVPSAPSPSDRTKGRRLKIAGCSRSVSASRWSASLVASMRLRAPTRTSSTIRRAENSTPAQKTLAMRTSLRDSRPSPSVARSPSPASFSTSLVGTVRIASPWSRILARPTSQSPIRRVFGEPGTDPTHCRCRTGRLLSYDGGKRRADLRR